MFWQSWHGTPDCSQSSASTSVSKGCSCTVQCSAGSSLLCPHSCSCSMSMLAFPLVAGGWVRVSATEQDTPELSLTVDWDRCWESHRKLARVLGCLRFFSALFQHVHALHECSSSFSHCPCESHWSSEQSVGTYPVADPIALACDFNISFPRDCTQSMQSSLLCALIGVPIPT